MVCTSIPRLSAGLHKKILNRYRKHWGYDLHYIEVEEREEYKHTRRNNIQIFKHWDGLQMLDKKYTHIIRLRNDVVFPDDKMRDLSTLFPIAQRKNFSVGIGPMQARKNVENWLSDEDVMIGDLAMFHPRDAMTNPWLVRDYLEGERIAHKKWVKLLKGNVYHFEQQAKVIREE